MKKILRRGIEFYKKHEIGIYVLALWALGIGITIYGKDGTFLLLLSIFTIGPFFVDVKDEDWP